MSDKEKLIEAFKSAGKPLRPGEIATATGIESKEVSKNHQGTPGRRKSTFA